MPLSVHVRGHTEAKFNKNLNASALVPNPRTNETNTKSLTLIR